MGYSLPINSIIADLSQKGTLLTSLLALTSAPALISISGTAVCFSITAPCNGVHPDYGTFTLDSFTKAKGCNINVHMA